MIFIDIFLEKIIKKTVLFSKNSFAQTTFITGKIMIFI